MGRVVEFNSSNWDSIFNFSATAGTTGGESSHIPIPPATAPIILTSSIIAAYISTTVPEGRRWTFGGRAVREFRSGLTVGGVSDVASKPEFLYVNKLTIIFFPKVTVEYTLSFYFPTWFKSVSLQCWQYTGTDDTTEDITLAQEFANLNFKIDQLTNQLIN